jgi:hypothetical protein
MVSAICATAAARQLRDLGSKFDKAFLEAEFERISTAGIPQFTDTMDLPGGRTSLDQLCRRFTILVPSD